MTIKIDGRKFTVKGPRGELVREFDSVKFTATLRGKRTLQIDMFSANRAEKACVRTVATHIENMIKGVTTGFLYKMRLAYNHFPLNLTIDKAKGLVEVRNFLGERRVRRVPLQPGVSIEKSTGSNKDEFILTGNNIEAVAGSCALIHESCLVRGKDIRKFLDGIYVSEKGTPKDLKSIL